VKRIFKYLVWLSLSSLVAIMAVGAILWYIWSSNLPYIGSLENYNPPVITEIFDSNNTEIGVFYNEKRIIAKLDQVPKNLLNAIVAAEDDKFYEHKGLVYTGILRSFIKGLMAARIKGGGSTITQQVARTVLLKDLSQTFKRKAKEVMLSIQIEKMFSKERILFLYINEVNLGKGAYGVEAASQTYFGKSAKDLNLAECAMIAGLYPSPTRYNPISDFEKAKERQKYVLQKMVKVGYITEAQEKEAYDTRLLITKMNESAFGNSQYFTEYIRRYLEKKYGKDLLYNGGLKVYTTMDFNLQTSAVNALDKGLHELDKREGYRGALRNISSGEIPAFIEDAARKISADPPEIGTTIQCVVTDVDNQNKKVTVMIGNDSGLLPISEMDWARRPNKTVASYSGIVQTPGFVLKKGDVILCKIKDVSSVPAYRWLVSLEQTPEVQGAFIAMDVSTGKVRAMVGGRDFSESQFDRATQAKRQTGSAIKPIIYSTAIDSGMTPSTVILDTAYVSSMESDPDEDLWRPKNYDGEFLGPTLLRNALIKSMNVITVKILQTIGPQAAIDYARKLGITADLEPNLSLALGSYSMTLKELTTAYSAFANGGSLVEPMFIEKIVDRNGLVLEENQPSVHRAIGEDTAYVMTDILRGVVNEGTAQRSKSLGRPVAGKTGTTNDLKDAWFVGFSPDLLAGVWVGYDDNKQMSRGESGAKAANPIWNYFMADALKDRPVEDFHAPDSVTFVKIDAETGLLSSAYSKKTVFQAFKKGTEPTEYSPKPNSAKSGQFQQFDMDFNQ
jgi:penicillin-binding protein 1A